jgi:general secretion pathway protein E
MAQRLVRTLCPSCKSPTELKEEDWKMLTRPWKTPMPKNAHQVVGCSECRNTGYKGRAGVYEIMPLSDNLKEYIHEDGQVAELRKEAIKEGMHSLRLSGANKISNGLTTIDEVLRVTPVSLTQLLS